MPLKVLTTSRIEEEWHLSLVGYLRSRVRFYRKCSAGFYELPIVSKRDYIDDYDSFLSSTFNGNRCALIGLLRDGWTPWSQEYTFSSDIILEQSSGSSGVPIRMPKTRLERAVLAASIWSLRRNVDSLVSPRNYLKLINNARGSDIEDYHRQTGRSYRDVVWEYIEEKGIRWVHVSPQLITSLVDSASLQRKKPPSLKFIECTGQLLSDATCRLVEFRTEAQCVNQYALREVWTVCSAIGLLDLGSFSSNVFVEVLRGDGTPTELGEEGRIVVTSKVLRLFPFVRYDTGDRGCLVSTTASGVCLRLAPYRAHDMIRGSRAEYPGIVIFKQILKEVGIIFSPIRLTFVQVRQQSPHEFAVVLSPIPNAEAVVRCIEDIFNRRKVMDIRARFSLRIEHNGEQQMLRKHSLFTSADVVAPGCGDPAFSTTGHV